MGLITKEVEVQINGNNWRHYKEKGYPIQMHRVRNRTVPIKENLWIKVEDLPEWSAKKVLVQCDYCDKPPYEISYNTYNHSKNLAQTNLYMCNICRLKSQVGENHPNWKPNKSSESLEKRREHPGYNEFIRTVMKRDNYSCVICGSKEKLVVHHLDGYNWCIDRRTDPTNGVTLCQTCHNNFHSKYHHFHGHNTKEQFDEWSQKVIELIADDIVITPTRKIYCIQENKIYEGARQLAKEWGIRDSQVYDACNHKELTTTVKGKHLLWLDEYEQMTPKQVDKYVRTHISKWNKSIINITEDIVFINLKSVGEKYHYSIGGYSVWKKRNGTKYAYVKSNYMTKKMLLMDYKDYLALTDEEIADLSEKFNLPNLAEQVAKHRQEEQ